MKDKNQLPQGATPPNVFTGFGMLLSTYEVVTPQSNIKLNVKGMTYGQESLLRSSVYTSPKSVDEQLLNVVYSCIVTNIPGLTDNINNFKSQISMVDLNAIYSGVYHATYGTEQKYDIQCPHCGKKYPYKVNLLKCANVNRFTKINESNGELEYSTCVEQDPIIHEFKIPDKNLTLKFYLVNPNILKYKEVELYKEINKINELDDILAFVRKIEFFDNNGNNKFLDTLDDIWLGISTLPSYVIDEIFNIINEKFNKYDVNFSAKIECYNVNCKKEFDWSLNLVNEIFRKLVRS